MGVVKLLDEYQNHKSRFLDTNYPNKLPIQIVKDYLRFFNITLNDISSLIRFSEEQIKLKRFVNLNRNNYNSLTEKESQIFTLVVNGKKTIEIANALFIEPCTVSTHRKHIKSKLDLHTIFDWYHFARAFNLLAQ